MATQRTRTTTFRVDLAKIVRHLVVGVVLVVLLLSGAVDAVVMRALELLRRAVSARAATTIANWKRKNRLADDFARSPVL